MDPNLFHLDWERTAATRWFRRRATIAPRTLVGLLVGLALLPISGRAQNQNPPSEDDPPDFVISTAFLENLREQKTFLPSYRIKMEHRSDIKTLAQDCEVHPCWVPLGAVFVG